MKKRIVIISIALLFLTAVLSGCRNTDSVWVCKPEKGLKIILNIDENAQHATVSVRPKNFVSPTNRDYLFHDDQQFHISNDTLYRIGEHGVWDGTDTDVVFVYGISKEDGLVITSKSENSMSLYYFGSTFGNTIREYVFEKK
ncbi:MAG: hypothetical protein J6T13_05850 [Bacteroidales bacterium]|nr:hypothetical protein [Bacteroidales bacterium]